MPQTTPNRRQITTNTSPEQRWREILVVSHTKLDKTPNTTHSGPARLPAAGSYHMGRGGGEMTSLTRFGGAG
jgi:hypothetical protein